MEESRSDFEGVTEGDDLCSSCSSGGGLWFESVGLVASNCRLCGVCRAFLGIGIGLLRMIYCVRCLYIESRCS